jgi:hypothetical protein
MTTVDTILTLGDGDFSFSASLRTGISLALETEATNTIVPYRLVATCFDSKTTVLEKYSSSSHSAIKILEAACDIDTSVFYETNATKALDSVLTHTGRPYADHIIFMFPHLGIEDSRLHAALLAHIIHRAMEVLARPEGRLYLALAGNAQYSRSNNPHSHSKLYCNHQMINRRTGNYSKRRQG